MKQKLSFEPHLVVKDVLIPPGQEWKTNALGWSLMQVTNGAGYMLHPRMNLDLITGSVLVCCSKSKGVIRASQLGEMRIHYFSVQTERLTGLVSLGEQQFLHRLTTLDHLTSRVFSPEASISQKFKTICDGISGNTFQQRLELLEVFILAFGNELANHSTAPETSNDARSRLANLLNETPASDLLGMSFSDLVRETRCTARHLSRIFSQVVGVSFREKQAQVRLQRAQELLATTESKVVEVALESGYQSLSLFNLMFKRRFGTTPAKWRDLTKGRRGAWNSPRTLGRSTYLTERRLANNPPRVAKVTV